METVSILIFRWRSRGVGREAACPAGQSRARNGPQMPEFRAGKQLMGLSQNDGLLPSTDTSSTHGKSWKSHTPSPTPCPLEGGQAASEGSISLLRAQSLSIPYILPGGGKMPSPVPEPHGTPVLSHIPFHQVDVDPSAVSKLLHEGRGWDSDGNRPPI